MGYEIATVTGTSGDEAHYKVLAAIKVLAEANGWTTMRYDTSGANKELILNSAGLSGTEDIYVGFKTYQSVASDYYNITVAGFTGYVAGNTFEGQPGYKASGVPCHNNAVTYFMTVNAQRIVGCFKVGTPVYTHFYVGKMFPYARPTEFPLPLIVAGMFNGPEGRRFSDPNYAMPYYGWSAQPQESGLNQDAAKMWLRTQDGTWNTQYVSPWKTIGPRRPAGADDSMYQLSPIILYNTTPNLWGELDGVFHVTGFNNNVENVIQIGGAGVIDQTGMTAKQAVDAIVAAAGRAFVVLQDVHRTGFANFVAVEMS